MRTEFSSFENRSQQRVLCKVSPFPRRHGVFVVSCMWAHLHLSTVALVSPSLTQALLFPLPKLVSPVRL